jgi:hypothetical protein
MYDKNGSCSVYVPTTHHHPPKWLVMVDGFDDKGTARKGWVSLDADVYERCAVDLTFSNGRCEQKDP